METLIFFSLVTKVNQSFHFDQSGFLMTLYQSCVHFSFFLDPSCDWKSFNLEMSLSWNFPARASPSYEGSKPSQAELGHFNFRAETELTIPTRDVIMGKCQLRPLRWWAESAPLVCIGLRYLKKRRRRHCILNGVLLGHFLGIKMQQ